MGYPYYSCCIKCVFRYIHLLLCLLEGVGWWGCFLLCFGGFWCFGFCCFFGFGVVFGLFCTLVLCVFALGGCTVLTYIFWCFGGVFWFLGFLGVYFGFVCGLCFLCFCGRVGVCRFGSVVFGWFRRRVG